MKITKSLLLLFITLLIFQSCYYDVEERLYPGGVCDVTTVTLSTRVKPILQGRCYSCHSAQNSASLGAGINLETYAGNNCLQFMAQNGKLLKSIKHEVGVSPMPKGVSAQIDACEIKIIEKWITDGAKND